MIILILTLVACRVSSQSYDYNPSDVPFARNNLRVQPQIGPFSPRPFRGNPNAQNIYNGYQGANVPIVTFSNEPPFEGTYAFSFTTADGKQVEENGFLKDAFVDNAGEPQGIQVMRGSYAYIAPDGTPIQVSYIADENGFRPSGINIPSEGRTPSPIVPEGLKDPRQYDPVFNRLQNPYLESSRYTRNNFYRPNVHRAWMKENGKDKENL